MHRQLCVRPGINNTTMTAQQMTFRLFNQMSGQKENFRPISAKNLRLYVCGPTVYDAAHIGNARPVVVFDLLFRLLRHHYGARHVTYIRNITDVDDKINERAARQGCSIQALTARTAQQYQADMAQLGALAPSHEPRATDHIHAMRRMIETLVAKGHAYIAADHILFDVTSLERYGRLSRRSLDEMRAGARVEIAPYKKNPLDFVLWKPSEDGMPSWKSPASITRAGRPGWHIECSAMAATFLGTTFDIHGGGADLVFPHHENEIAQSCAAHGTHEMANYWLHNGMLLVEGRKMSKSAGNFFTIRGLLSGAHMPAEPPAMPWTGAELRLALMHTHYRQPLDFTARLLLSCRQALTRWARALPTQAAAGTMPPSSFIEALGDDLNTPAAIAIWHRLARAAREGDRRAAHELHASLSLAGFDLTQPATGDARMQAARARFTAAECADITQQIKARDAARQAGDFDRADAIRHLLAERGVRLTDRKDPRSGATFTEWE